MISDGALIWVDCEMTGLSSSDRLLEIAVIVTDSTLTTVIPGPNLIIRQSAEVLDTMNDWCKKQFGWRSAADYDADNLAYKALKSEISEADAEGQILAFLRQHVPKGAGVLAGNTVHMDKRFIDKFMPNLSGFMHYRIVDVSTVKELCRRWSPEIFAQVPPKAATHRALDDILESIAELRFYKNSFFLLPSVV